MTLKSWGAIPVIMLVVLVVTGGVFGGRLWADLRARKAGNVVIQNVVIKKDDGLYVIVKDKGTYQTKKVADGIPDMQLAWRLPGGKVLVLSGRRISIKGGESGADLCRTKDFYILDLSQGEATTSQRITLTEGSLYVRLNYPGYSDLDNPDGVWTIALADPEGQGFNQESFVNVLATETEPLRGPVFAVNVTDGHRIPVFIFVRRLTCTPAEFSDGSFVWTPSGELIYTDQRQVYRGSNDGQKIDLQPVYAAGEFLISAIGYIPGGDCVLIDMRGNGMLELMTIDPQKSKRSLLHVEGLPGQDLGPAGVLKTVNGSSWFTFYIDAPYGGHPPGSWLVNAMTGENHYLGKESLWPASTDRGWYEVEHRIGMFDPPTKEIQRWMGDSFTTGFTLPGWFEQAMVAGPPGREYVVGLKWHQAMVPGAKDSSGPEAELYVYEPGGGYIQFLTAGIKGVL